MPAARSDCSEPTWRWTAPSGWQTPPPARSAYQPGPSRLTLIDDGDAIITNRRVILHGPKPIREWRFSKFVGVTHSDGGYWSALHVSNGQKASGIGYGPDHVELVLFRLDLAAAEWWDARTDLVEELAQQVENHQSLKPVDPGDQR